MFASEAVIVPFTGRNAQFARSPLERIHWLAYRVLPAKVSRNAMALAILLAQCVNAETGDAYPSRETVMKRTGFSNPKRAIRELEDAGLIGVTRNPGKANRYVLIIDGDQPLGWVSSDPTGWVSHDPQTR